MSGRKTQPPSAAEHEKASLEEQSALTMALQKHADPHVRLIAHISERQLTLSYRMTEMLTELREVRKEVKSVSDKIDSLSDGQGAIESRLEDLEAIVVPG